MFPARDGIIAARENPGRGTEEEREMCNLGLDQRDELDGGSASANDGHAFICQIVVMLPLCGMKQGTLELLNTWNGRE